MSLAFYAMSTFEGPVMASKTVNALSHYTDWTIGHVHSGALGWNLMVAAGSLYHIIEKIYNIRLSQGLLATHFWLHTIGTVTYIVAMWVSGIMQGLMWRQYDSFGTLQYTFAESVSAMHPYYVMRATGGVLIVIGAILMLVNIVTTIRRANAINDNDAVATA
jgi:cytochrome c oxidase cbb3-type subunit 1